MIRTLKKLWNYSLKMSEVATAVSMKRKAEEGSESSKKVKNCKKEPVPQMQGNPNAKRKVVVLIAYNGKGYHGIQRNPPYPSIEEEILKALLSVNAITQEHYDKPGVVHFQRAARTDKHVSAASNILSLKMVTNVENFTEKVNEALPEQIRLFGFKRTTKGFDCKTQCTGRTYMYVLPTYALAPLEMNVTDEYRVTEEVLTHVNAVLKLYAGTHNFHNFTSGIKPTEQKAKRYIIAFECGQPYVREGLEFVTCKVRGQSFMLHHIRKMIGLMIAIVKGYCKEDVLELAWGPEKVDVPKAPGLGLLLNELYFDGYNKKWGRDGLHEAIEWSEYEEELEKFKEDYILPEIYKGEKNDRVMWDWLKTLHMHTFDVESKNKRRHRNEAFDCQDGCEGNTERSKEDEDSNQNQGTMLAENQSQSVEKSTENQSESVEKSTEDQKESVGKNSEPFKETKSQDVLTSSFGGEDGKESDTGKI